MKTDIESLPPRMKREHKTVDLMIKLYCQDHHHPDKELCGDCQELADYATVRLTNCPFQQNKTTCGNCPIHCYKPQMREKIKKVMRYSGPRMMKHHPLLAIGHVIDGWRKHPGPKK